MSSNMSRYKSASNRRYTSSLTDLSAINTSNNSSSNNNAISSTVSNGMMVRRKKRESTPRPRVSYRKRPRH
jgi:hypothetical protein